MQELVRGLDRGAKKLADEKSKDEVAMNCQRIEGNLIAYLDTRAMPAERRQVEAHLAECAACNERVHEFRLLFGMLDELPAVAPSASFDAAVRGRVASDSRGAGFWSALLPSPRLAFALTALVAFSVWLASFSPSRAPVRNGAPQTIAQVGSRGSEAEFGMIKNLPVLEDYDVLANFDVLSELPSEPATLQHN